MSHSEILDLVRRWADAERTGDVAAYDGLLAEDFLAVGPVGFVLPAKAWAGRHRGDLVNHEFEVLDPQVRLYGDTAVMHGEQKQRTTARGRDASGSYRVTLVAVRQDGVWRIAHLQLSGPLRDAAAPPPFPKAGPPAAGEGPGE
ncbi:nuclear transport factor 2 family protein [Spirillospora sp. NPDC049652]